eukprot:7072850-Pyramimonas_sp.AAC.1
MCFWHSARISWICAGPPPWRAERARGAAGGAAGGAQRGSKKSARSVTHLCLWRFSSSKDGSGMPPRQTGPKIVPRWPPEWSQDASKVAKM